MKKELKPTLWWLNRIKDPTIRSRAIKCMNIGGKNNKVRNISSAINKMCYWSSTEEGHSYWSNLKNNPPELISSTSNKSFIYY
jgi:hypothetical protein